MKIIKIKAIINMKIKEIILIIGIAWLYVYLFEREVV